MSLSTRRNAFRKRNDKLTIIQSQRVIYTGFTTDLKTRVWAHFTKQNPTSFAARYNVNRLVYYQGFLSITEAESAEKYIKGKKREWKRALISKHNPKWKNLRLEIEEVHK